MKQSKYTETQYHHFVENAGYQKEQHWTLECRQWLAGVNTDLSGIEYDDRRKVDETGPSARILRGGSLYHSTWLARCTYRDRSIPDSFDDNGSFRCVVSLAISES